MFFARDYFFLALSLNGAWSFLIFLVLPFLFFLIVVLLVPVLCPHSTSPMYLVRHFFLFFFPHEASLVKSITKENFFFFFDK